MKKLILVLLTAATTLASCSSFKNEAKEPFNVVEQLHEISLQKSQATLEVWRTAIFDNKYALTSSTKFEDYYVGDFNTAIFRMEKEPVIVEMNKKIDSLKGIADKVILDITDKNDDSYEKFMSYYANVVELSRIALEPTGNLQSYAEEIKKLNSNANILQTEIKVRNPDFK